ncbi:MAG TPA: type I 3-dehydroquinate dehydratase [Spirochaetota bacterium]|nr:type I 3-dehydroquinate dehydratase [Spirochaetota bacterium]
MICVSIADLPVSEAIKIIESNELSEVRLDRIKFGAGDIEKLFLTKNKTIATYRPVESVSDSERKKILIEAVNAGASYVDIEVENDDDFKNEIIEAAKLKNCKTIVSYHNYTKTPVIRELEQIMRWCFESRCDIAKIACHVDSNEGCSRLLSLYSYGNPIIAIGMGDDGKITRIAATLLGAPFTYASIDDSKQTAPGQFDSVKLKTIIDMIRNS